MLFIQWLEATRRPDQPLADYYRARFRADFKPAFEAWLKLDPQNNPDAPSPFALPEYRPQQFVGAEKAEQAADEAAAQIQNANDNSADYVRNTLFTAMALFFGGIAARMEYRPVRIGMLALAGLMLLIGVANIVILPKL